MQVKIFLTKPILIIGYDPAIVKKSESDRFRDPALVDQIIEIDNEWRKGKIKWLDSIMTSSSLVTFLVDTLKKEQNQISKTIGQRMKESKGQD